MKTIMVTFGSLNRHMLPPCFGLGLPADMQGVALCETIASDRLVREVALFGVHGGHVNVTDGRYADMRGPHSRANRPFCEYTLMPTHVLARFGVEELEEIELAEPCRFTKGRRTLRITARGATGGTHIVLGPSWTACATTRARSSRSTTLRSRGTWWPTWHV